MQHNNWGKDRDFLAEAYLQTANAAPDDEANYSIEDDPITEPAAEEAAEDGENETGDMSDEDLLALARTDRGKLKPEARDALAKLYGHEDGEGHDRPHSEEEASNYYM